MDRLRDLAIGCDNNRFSDRMFTRPNKSASCRGSETEDVSFFFSSGVHLCLLELVIEIKRLLSQD